MLIEHWKPERVVVAVKIGSIMAGIAQDLIWRLHAGK
jgi:hypothetical protein